MAKKTKSAAEETTKEKIKPSSSKKKASTSKKSTSSRSSTVATPPPSVPTTAPPIVAQQSVAASSAPIATNAVPSPSTSVVKQKKPSKKATTSKSSSVPSSSVTNNVIPQNTMPLNFSHPMMTSLPFPTQFASHNSKTMQAAAVEIPYLEEISNMLMVFCNSNRVDTQSVRIIERFTRNHILDLISKVIAQQNNESSSENVVNISPDDILFLFRKNPLKLSRIENMLKMKELRKGDEDPSTHNVEEVGKKRKKISDKSTRKLLKLDPLMEIGQFSDDDSDQGVASPTLPSQKKKKNNSSESVNLTEKRTDDLFISIYLQEKRMAADYLSRYLSVNDYMEYTKCRESNFITKGFKKFVQWLEIPADIKINEHTLEILAIEAYETVGLLSQIALISVIDKENRHVTMFEHNLFLSAGLLSERERRAYAHFPHLQTPTDLQAVGSVTSRGAILPVHFLDAITKLHPPSLRNVPDFSLTI